MATLRSIRCEASSVSVQGSSSVLSGMLSLSLHGPLSGSSQGSIVDAGAPGVVCPGSDMGSSLQMDARREGERESRRTQRDKRKPKGCLLITILAPSS